MQADFVAIRDGLRRLSSATLLPKVFGSQAHEFRTNPPLPESVVRDFEVRHRVVLPADYRGFLMHVGNGGAGPAYGLFPLGTADGGAGDGPRTWQEGDGFVGILAEPFPHTEPWNDLTGEPEYDEDREDDPAWEEEYQRQLNAWESVYWGMAHVNGAVPICHLGCALRQWLVLTGPEAGHVWDDDRVDHAGLKPHRRGERRRTTFLQWYSDWLDEALRQLR